MYVALRQCLTTGKSSEWSTGLHVRVVEMGRRETVKAGTYALPIIDLSGMVLSDVAHTVVHTCAIALSSYAPFSHHILLFQLFFRRQESISPVRENVQNVKKFYQKVLEAELAASPVPVFPYFVLLLLPTLLLEVTVSKSLGTAFSTSSYSLSL